jgi:hypothetical protein
MRTHREKTERNLVVAGLAALLLIGGGIMWWQYGLGAAAATWACLAFGAFLLLLLYLILKLAEMWVSRR